MTNFIIRKGLTNREGDDSFTAPHSFQPPRSLRNFLHPLLISWIISRMLIWWKREYIVYQYFDLKIEPKIFWFSLMWDEDLKNTFFLDKYLIPKQTLTLNKNNTSLTTHLWIKTACFVPCQKIPSLCSLLVVFQAVTD